MHVHSGSLVTLHADQARNTEDLEIRPAGSAPGRKRPNRAAGKPERQLRYRLQCLATMLDALHAPVFDQHLIDLATDGMMAFAGDGSGSAAEQQDGGGTSPASDAH